MWLAQLLFPIVTNAAIFAPWPSLVFEQPWRFLTAAFLHSTPWPIHILFNMYTLWIFGQVLEPMLGRTKFLMLYLLTALGGSVGVYCINFNEQVTVLGASGALFGLMGALVVMLKRRAMQYQQLIVLIVLNFVLGFLWSGVSWEAHLGGLLTGGLVGLLFERQVVRGSTTLTWVAAVAVCALLVVVVVARTVVA